MEAVMNRLIVLMEDWIPALLMVVMCILMVSEVFARYILNHSIAWSSEIAVICFIWLVYIGAVAVMRRRRHISVEALRDRLSPRGRAILDAVNGLILVVTLSLTGWQAWILTAYTHFTPIPATGLSRRILAIPLLISCFGMLAHVILQLVTALNGARSGSYDVRAEALGDSDRLEHPEVVAP
jgi:TRAP-type C4-dicarboxylate transport system permease small subunit